MCNSCVCAREGWTFAVLFVFVAVVVGFVVSYVCLISFCIFVVSFYNKRNVFLSVCSDSFKDIHIFHFVQRYISGSFAEG